MSADGRPRSVLRLAAAYDTHTLDARGFLPVLQLFDHEKGYYSHAERTACIAVAPEVRNPLSVSLLASWPGSNNTSIYTAYMYAKSAVCGTNVSLQ